MRSCLVLIFLLCSVEIVSAETTVFDAQDLDPIVVTASRTEEPLREQTYSIGVIDRYALQLIGHTHVNELGFRIPGVWFSRGNGQEHLTAIRSPVLTGAGACGAFLYLEDGIPIRPAGFCNVNELFEINTEQAESIEIMRGPGNVLYGSNALHGMVNVVTPAPGVTGFATSAEAGPDDFYRLSVDMGHAGARNAFRAVAHGEHYDGWRDDSGYDQQKLNAAYTTNLADATDLGLRFAATNLNQETAGFILGQDAYQDESLRTTNPNSEAYRDADAQRLTARFGHQFDGATELVVTPYVRRARMDFLQHFLPGQPTEQNGQDSFGFLTMFHWNRQESTFVAGLDVEWADGFLKETQPMPITTGSPILQETRPAGVHYDYRVDSFVIAPWLRARGYIGERARWNAGVRYESLRYDYDNEALDGNTRDDGTTCGFGGCLFNRPADRTDRFDNVAPDLGIAFDFDERHSGYLQYTRGFRAPQAIELYRLQRGQDVADIDPETLDSLELGLRRRSDRLRLDTAVFTMKKKNFIFRDANGFNVSAGQTRHHGIEVDMIARLSNSVTLGITGTYARHLYDFDRDVAGGEMIRSGNDVDTAPRVLASLRTEWSYRPDGVVEFEWVHVGPYDLDAANLHVYGGHDLVNVRIQQQLNPQLTLSARINNLTDTRYAERADFAFGNYRYFPGRDRSLFLQIEYIVGR